MSLADPVWHVAVYAANEQRHLDACLASIRAALQRATGRITVLLNGSVDGSAAIAASHAAQDPRIALATLPQRDKSAAINHFLFHLRGPADYVAQIDGYACIAQDTFQAFQHQFAADPHMQAQSGTPLSGRSMRRGHNPSGGQLYGQLHAIRNAFLDRLVARQFRLPVGLYRGDGLLGSMIAHDLDPQTLAWDSTRIGCAAGAGFTIPQLSPWRPADLRRYHDRRIRQARGRMENRALQAVIFAHGYAALPASADDLLRSWISANPQTAMADLHGFYHRLALHRLRVAGQDRPGVASPSPAPDIPTFP